MDARTLRAAAPGLSAGRSRAYLPHLERAMREAGITTLVRAQYFLAQLMHESVSLVYFEEIASGAAYEGRRDLGNVRPGDGRRFKGRGPIQLTGRNNYRAAGEALNLPLEKKPWLAATPQVGFRVAAWFWRTRGLNDLADRHDFLGVTKRINGGTNGYADRLGRLRSIQGLGGRVLPRAADPLEPDERYHVRLLTKRGVSAARRDRAATWLQQRAKVLTERARRDHSWSKLRRGSRRKGIVRPLAAFRRRQKKSRK